MYCLLEAHEESKDVQYAQLVGGQAGEENERKKEKTIKLSQNQFPRIQY